ncbi:MAG: hypothetical protein R3F11_19730 [Verrucomicrobiales bacterium]
MHNPAGIRRGAWHVRERRCYSPIRSISTSRRRQTVAFPRRPLIMGIVNINDDSFSGDGTLDAAAALARAQRCRQGRHHRRRRRRARGPTSRRSAWRRRCERLRSFLRGYGATMAAAERWDSRPALAAASLGQYVAVEVAEASPRHRRGSAQRHGRAARSAQREDLRPAHG